MKTTVSELDGDRCSMAAVSDRNFAHNTLGSNNPKRTFYYRSWNLKSLMEMSRNGYHFELNSRR